MSRISKAFLRRQSRYRNRIKLAAKKKIASKSNDFTILRLCVSKFSRTIFAQVINDDLGHTVASVSTLSKSFPANEKSYGVKAADWVARQISDKMKSIKYNQIIFDKGGYKMHGIIKTIAEVSRENGLEF
ncbi:50S ribosomal protein L18 [Candidatus Nesciobacter abundans]|uniref:50S ribosomal protein L18 n=1 Tax=Candidatus Nesciobacter abundans TaxID=2601668 RepID=A0A5C0UGU1_9PROT|nr:50S ribosomal protein L18 [Candidatus Nesciobacter abundans]QEK38917.1 50S ribosomal protein L18 [Candidatus Nesciobacter abundans]